MISLLLAVAIGVAPDTSKVRTDTVPVTSGPVRRATFAPTDTVRRRRTVELSDAYYTRLTIHRWASYVELPLFAAEYVVGDKLMSRGTPIAGWVKPTHVGLAMGIAGLFGINTITGGWNLIEGWSQNTDNRALIVAHSALMLAADGGFALAPLVVHRNQVSSERQHRTIAVASMSAATVSTLMMWIAKNR